MDQRDCDDVTGVILVGGKSLRMGRDKAFLRVAGRTLFERVLDVLGESLDRILLVGDRAERFAAYGLPVLPDIHPGSALGGIHTGLLQAETGHIFVASCDLAYPSGAVLSRLCSLRAPFDAVVPRTAHGFEPLFAVYAKSCLGPIEEYLAAGHRCAYGYYPNIRIRCLQGDELASLDRDGRAFVNVNTPKDYEKMSKGETR